MCLFIFITDTFFIFLKKGVAVLHRFDTIRVTFPRPCPVLVILAHSNGGQWQRCPDRVQKSGGPPD